MIIQNPSLVAEGWEIFYKDDTIISSLDSAWEDAPSEDILGVIIWHEYHVEGCRKKTMVGGHDYYLYVNQNYWGNTDDFELVKDLVYKKGIWTTDKQMEAVQKVMFEKLDIG